MNIKNILIIFLCSILFVPSYGVDEEGLNQPGSGGGLMRPRDEPQFEYLFPDEIWKSVFQTNLEPGLDAKDFEGNFICLGIDPTAESFEKVQKGEIAIFAKEYYTYFQRPVGGGEMVYREETQDYVISPPTRYETKKSSHYYVYYKAFGKDAKKFAEGMFAGRIFDYFVDKPGYTMAMTNRSPLQVMRRYIQDEARRDDRFKVLSNIRPVCKKFLKLSDEIDLSFTEDLILPNFAPGRKIASGKYKPDDDLWIDDFSSHVNKFSHLKTIDCTLDYAHECFGDDNVFYFRFDESLIRFLNKITLSRLNLKVPLKITNRGADVFKKFFKKNKTFQSLNIRLEEFSKDSNSDYFCVKLYEALRRNNVVASLRIDGLSRGSYGANYLLKSLKKNKSLKELRLGFFKPYRRQDDIIFYLNQAVKSAKYLKFNVTLKTLSFDNGETSFLHSIQSLDEKKRGKYNEALKFFEGRKGDLTVEGLLPLVGG